MFSIERRCAPRFVVSLRGTVVTQEGLSSAIEVFNISSSGLRFAIGQAKIPRLLPNVSHKNTLNPVSVQLNIDLQDNHPQIQIKCGIVYVQRKSLEQCVIGCRFEVFLDDSSERLERYIYQLASKESSAVVSFIQD